MIGNWRRFIFHLRPKKVPKEALNFKITFGLGGISVFLFCVACITGVLLMFYYIPSESQAYISTKVLNEIVPLGKFIRNMHRLSGELMIIFAFLHAFRIVLQNALNNEIRRENWRYGVILFLLIFPFNFTGYILPFDTLSYWGASVVLNAFDKIPFLGHHVRILISGENYIGETTLLRFYTYHIVLIPCVFSFFLGVHIYNVRKAKGVYVKKMRDYVDGVELFKIEILSGTIAFLILLTVSIFFYSAPLMEPATSSNIPEFVKAPWYFSNLQLLLMYLPPVIVAFIIPLGYTIYMLLYPEIGGKKSFVLLHFFVFLAIIIFQWMRM